MTFTKQTKIVSFYYSLQFVWVQLYGGPGLPIGLVDGVMENNVNKVMATCATGRSSNFGHIVHLTGF